MTRFYVEYRIAGDPKVRIRRDKETDAQEVYNNQVLIARAVNKESPKEHHEVHFFESKLHYTCGVL